MPPDQAHLVPLVEGWSAWKWFLLRGTGFPASLVLELAAGDVAALIDELDRDPAARERAARALDAEYARISGAIRRIAGDARFREAVLWQNRNMLPSALDPVLRRDGRASNRVRRQERAIAMYLQRYCAKNDTIGFFGPVCWATIGEHERAIELRHGPELLARRTVYFEHWAIDALAELLARDAEIGPYLAPRRMPALRLEGAVVHHAGGTLELPEPYAILAAACDGETPARAIAERLVADERAGVTEPDEVYEMLDVLVAKRIVTWTIELPVGSPFPEVELQRALDAIADEAVRARATARLQPVVAARDRVARCAGDPPALEQAIAALEASFRELSGIDATRKHGEAYAGRTLVYEDCVRDLECSLSRRVLEEVAAPLALVLQSARWFTAEVARRCHEVVAGAYERLRDAGGRVEYLRLWEAIGPLLTDETGVPELVTAAAAELQARWAGILLPGGAAGARRVELACDRLAPAVREAFAADAPGWIQARFHAPDLMIAAASAEAVDAGAFQVVLGELHVAANSLFAHATIAQARDPEQLYRAAASDLPGTVLAPVEAKRFVTRADYQPLKPGDYQLELGATRASYPRARVLAIGELVVVKQGDRFVLESVDGAHRFDVMNLLGDYLSVAAIGAFKILPHAGHTPRVSIGKLVIERERWTFDTEALAFRGETDDLARFAGARRWAREHGLPRFVFVKLAEEPKPFLVDFASVVYVDILAHHLRRGSRAVFTEMLPGLDELWLRDARGNAYTTELRTAFRDPIAFAPVA